jgi:excisionase family DNA binding protein
MTELPVGWMECAMNSQDEKTLTVEEAGRRYFGLCKMSSYRAVKKGDIPVIRVGRLMRVPVAAMERMMQERRDDPNER